MVDWPHTKQGLRATSPLEFNAIFRDGFPLRLELNGWSKIRDPVTVKFKHVTVIVTCTLLRCDDVTYVPALWNFQKADLKPYPYGKKYTTFSFPIHGALASNICLGDAPTCSCIQLYTQCSGSLTFQMCSPRKSDENFSILTFLWIKTNVAYTRLEVIGKQRSVLQVEFITGVKLICYFVLYYCFLHWSHLPNMAVGDLAFYYTLYLWHKAITKSCKIRLGVKVYVWSNNYNTISSNEHTFLAVGS